MAYIAYLWHNALDAPSLDDWFDVRLAESAVGGHLSLSYLWQQYNESRIFISRVILVIFALTDRLDLRAVILFNGALLVVSYGLVLALFYRYSMKRLDPLSVIVIGAIWLSLADVGNSLWSFQLSWYLGLFFLTAMLCAFFLPSSRSMIWLGLAGVLAVAASFSIIQGFAVWPVGLLCILWQSGQARRKMLEVTLWLAATAATLAIYASGFSFGKANCSTTPVGRICSTSVALHRPWEAFQYLLILMGDVVPGSVQSGINEPHHPIAAFELLGAVLLITCGFIIVQSMRLRTSTERIPLSMLLISFSLLFDLDITAGRVTLGINSAFTNRYIMPNLVLLTGIAVFILKYLGRALRRNREVSWRLMMHWVGAVVFAVFILAQVVVATNFGLHGAMLNRRSFSNDVRIAVNIDRYPVDEQACELSVMAARLWSPADAARIFAPIISKARADRLTVFAPKLYESYRAKGPLPLNPTCLNVTSEVAR